MIDWDAPLRMDSSGTTRRYIRFVALGDSATHGLGDPVDHGWRGWARILAGSIAREHDVSFANTARPGACVKDVRVEQLEVAVRHRPHIASVIVGLNDAMRSGWDPQRIRADLLHTAGRLDEQGAVLLSVRFHDHSQVLRLPRILGRPMGDRIHVLNDIYDEIHDRFGGCRVDLAGHPAVYDREFWSIDRLHPSELGHRALAEQFAALLIASGLDFTPPDLALDGSANRLHELRWLVGTGAPWLARRARDLGPAAARSLLVRRRPPLGQEHGAPA